MGCGAFGRQVEGAAGGPEVVDAGVDQAAGGVGIVIREPLDEREVVRARSGAASVAIVCPCIAGLRFCGRQERLEAGDHERYECCFQHLCKGSPLDRLALDRARSGAGRPSRLARSIRQHVDLHRLRWFHSARRVAKSVWVHTVELLDTADGPPEATRRAGPNSQNAVSNHLTDEPHRPACFSLPFGYLDSVKTA